MNETDEPTFFDHYWSGKPASVAAAIASFDTVIGPATYDGVAYVCVRSGAPIELPSGLKLTPQTGRALLGEFAE